MQFSWQKGALLLGIAGLTAYWAISSHNFSSSLAFLCITGLWLFITPDEFLSGKAEDPDQVKFKAPTRAEKIQLNAAIWGGQASAVALGLMVFSFKSGDISKESAGWYLAGGSLLNLLAYIVVKVLSEARYGDMPDKL